MDQNCCNGVVVNGEISPNSDTGFQLQTAEKCQGNIVDHLKKEVEAALRDRDRWEEKAKKLQNALDCGSGDVNGYPCSTQQDSQQLSQTLENERTKNLELERLKNEMEAQRNGEVHFLNQQLQEAQNRIRDLEKSSADSNGHIDYLRKQVHDAQSLCKDLENACSAKDSKIQEMELRISSLQNGLASRGSSSPQQPERKNSNNMEAVLELADELKTVHQRKYKLEGEIGQLGTDLRNAQTKCQELEAEVHRLREELGKTYPRQRQIEEERAHFEWEKNELGRKLWESGERVGWLERELDGVHNRKRELEYRCGELQKFKDKVYKYLPDAFIIRKEPCGDRSKWPMPLWNDNKEEHYVRVWFEIDVPWAHDVYLLGSFLNWECGLLCTWHDHGKWGVWIDIPKGHHEFRFMVDGQWRTSENFERVPTEFGSENNVIDVS